MTVWLGAEVLAHEQDLEHLKEVVYARFRQLRIEPPDPEPIRRLIQSALHTYEERLFATIAARLSPAT